MRQGVKTLQVRAGTVSRGHTHKGKVSGSHEAGGENGEREALCLPFLLSRQAEPKVRSCTGSHIPPCLEIIP